MADDISLQPGSFGAPDPAPGVEPVPVSVLKEGQQETALPAVPEADAVRQEAAQPAAEPAPTAETSAEPAAEEPPPTNNAAFNYDFTVGEAIEKELGGLPQPFNDEQAQRLSAQLIHRYFTTQNNPLSRHHLESFDQFLQRDLPAILKANPIRLLKNPKEKRQVTDMFDYQVDVYIGGKTYDKLTIGVPTLIQGRGEQAEKRILFPNEARLRNLTYSAPIFADIEIDLKVRDPPGSQNLVSIPIAPIENFRILNMPIMLHSKYCILHNKPQALLERMGECPQDPGGYFIIDGSEKVLVTSQEQSFNTLWVKEQPADEQCQYYANISCLNSVTRDVRSVAFYWTREKIQKGPGFDAPPVYKQSVLEVSIPDVLKPIPVFVLFRALGIETDKDILETIVSDLHSPEAIDLGELLIPSINAASPFLDSYSALEYIRLLTKTQNINSVLDILYNKLFCHVKYADLRRNADGKFVDEMGVPLTQQQLNTFIKSEQASRISFLADCVRKILRVVKGYEQPASRDDTRNQRLLTSGFLCQQLFQYAYKQYVRSVKLTIDSAYAYNEKTYEGKAFANIFDAGSRSTIFAALFLTEQMIKGFKGQWQIGVSKKSEGVLQELSRLSYLDFISHLRRAVLDFDTTMKLTGPRRLHTSQYGYFCTSETPSGANIGIVKNLTILTAISTSMLAQPFIEWLTRRTPVVPIYKLTNDQKLRMIPVFVNNSVIGYLGGPTAELTSKVVNDTMYVLKSMKRSGHLPAMCSITFDRFERKLCIYTDEGRPCRPLIICSKVKVGEEERATLPNPSRFGAEKREEKRLTIKPWRELVVGTMETMNKVGIYSREFIDPFKEKDRTDFQEYIDYFRANEEKLAVIEYLDPYEQNMALIANFPKHIQVETTHMEVHPSTILGLLGNCIPYPNHNQSPRNQLSASQSKQGLSLYATNWQNRFDNTANVLCYGEAPLVRTLYQDYFGDGKMSYGQNIILAIGTYGGYNQEDGIIMNKDALDRGQFRSINYRSYETREEEENIMTRTSYTIAHPSKVSSWLDLKPGLDYGKLDPETGIIKEGTYVTADTVLVARYSYTRGGQPKDASLTPQVFTTGLVEKVVVLLNNMGKRLVKIRIVQDRVPVLGDKFCLTPDHEVLTKRGWIGIADITLEDQVAQLNKEKECIEYVHPKETFKFEHDGEMYEVKTQGVNLCTTLNHRMWVQKRDSKQYELLEAKDIMGKRMRFSSYSPSSSKPYCLSIGEQPFNEEQMKSFLTLLGIWIAEGWVYQNSRDCIARLEFAANKPVVKETLSNVCDELKLKYSYNENTKKFYINSKDFAEFFSPYSVGAIQKRLPSWCLELSMEQSRILLESLCMGDGHQTLTSLHYGTSSIGLRDDIQILTQHAGYTSTYVKRMEKGQVNIDTSGRQYKANADHWGIYIRRKRLNPTLNHGHAKTQGGQSEKIIQYSGKVYCISVPSEVFLVRREGTIVWTGNSNRHGQKGTLNIAYRGHDMPRTADGMIPDMIMNPSAIPSRMTMGQILEQIMGLTAANVGAIANSTAFMNHDSPHTKVEEILEKYGIQKVGNQVLYNGVTGEQMEADIYMGIVYGMRLKHMTIDKMNSRGQGRKEMKTRQPTGGRGNEGGLKIGEMDRDSILAHGVSSFLQESMMLRSDASSFVVCNGCGTIPIYNVKRGLYMCPMCDGPIQYSGDTADTLEPIPPPAVSQATFSRIEIPYASKLLIQELETFLNMGLRILTTGQVAKLHGMDTIQREHPDLKGTLVLPDPGKGIRLPELTIQRETPAPAPTAAQIETTRENAVAAEDSIAVGQQALKPGETSTYTGYLPPPAPAPGGAAVVATSALGNNGPPAPAPGGAAPAPAPTNTFGAASQQPLVGGSMGTTLQQGPATPIAATQPTLAATLTNVPATAPSVNGPAPELVAANQVAQQKALDQGLPPPPPISNGPPAELVPGTTIPVISVDTSEQALAADGLNESAPSTLPTPGEAYKSANRTSSTRRLPRRQPSPQPSYSGGPSEPSAPATQPQAPVRVIKEG